MASTIRGSDNFDSAGGNAVKAWVNFNGTGTVAIRAGFNVSSITDTGVGDYTVNFTSALASANYSVVATLDYSGGAAVVPIAFTRDDATPRTTAAFKLSSRGTAASGAIDSAITQVAVFL